MNFQQTTRGVEDLLYTLGTALERFKGVNGLQRLVTAGRLSLLSLFGEFERTRDEVYERRSAAVGETRRCLLQLLGDFDGVAETTEKLVRRLDKLQGTLEQFHRCCDMEIDDRSHRDNSDVQQQERDFQQMRESNAQLKSFLDDFSAAKETCVDLTRSAILQIEKVNTDTSCDVAAALTDFDRQRRRVQVKENEVMHAMARAASRDDPTVQFAEFNYQRESEALEGLGRKYIDSLAGAMVATHFALEQSSMTGWAASNVFFVQLGLLFSGLSTSGKVMAASLLSIKNSQKVSRQLTEEKKRILQEQRATAAAAVAAATSTAASHFIEGSGALSEVQSPHTVAHRSSESSLSAAPPQSPRSDGAMASRYVPERHSVNLDDLFQ